MLFQLSWLYAGMIAVQPLITDPADVGQLSGDALASWGEDYIDCAGSFLALATLTEKDPKTRDTHAMALQQADDMAVVAAYLLRSFAGDDGSRLAFAQTVATDIGTAGRLDLGALTEAEAETPEKLKSESDAFQMKVSICFSSFRDVTEAYVGLAEQWLAPAPPAASGPSE